MLMPIDNKVDDLHPVVLRLIETSGWGSFPDFIHRLIVSLDTFNDSWRSFLQMILSVLIMANAFLGDRSGLLFVLLALVFLLLP